MITLRNIFFGLIRNYRCLNLRYDPQLESKARWTGAEIGWLAEIGERLGFYAVAEKQLFSRRRPMDLAWVDPFTRAVVLHVERENETRKIKETIEGKLLPRASEVSPFAVAIFDEIDEKHISIVEATAIRAFSRQTKCREFLAICYSDIPSRRAGSRAGLPRYWLEWPVRGLHLSRSTQPLWLQARCTTDKNFLYTMYLTNPQLPGPNEKVRWGNKAIQRG